MVTLDRTDWRARLFRWSLGIWDEFKGSHTDAHDGTNLCHFTRTIFVYMPLVLALHLALLAGALYCVTAFPVLRFGFGPWVVAVLLIAALAWGIPRFKRIFLASCAAIDAMTEHLEKNQRPKRERKGPSTRAMFWLWVKSQKQKVCPSIQFSERKGRHEAI